MAERCARLQAGFAAVTDVQTAFSTESGRTVEIAAKGLKRKRHIKGPPGLKKPCVSLGGGGRGPHFAGEAKTKKQKKQ